LERPSKCEGDNRVQQKIGSKGSLDQIQGKIKGNEWRNIYQRVAKKILRKAGQSQEKKLP